MKYRSDETWHRLIDWTESSARAERLAFQILHDAGYADIDPSHPLGGKDGGKDAVCSKDNTTYLVAVYFPRGQKDFGEILKKFSHDLNGAVVNGAKGFAFVTNQELRIAERNALISSADSIEVDVFHLERLASILDKPSMAGIRGQFLDIDFSNEELKAAIREEVARSHNQVTGFQAGGDTFCYWMLYHFDLEKNCAKNFVIIRNGHFPLYDVRVRIMDVELRKDVFKKAWGEISAPAEYSIVSWPLQSRMYYRVFFHARNGQWHQDLQLRRSDKAKCWLAATRVSDTKGNPRFDTNRRMN